MCTGYFYGSGLKWYMSLLLTFRWLEVSHMAMPNYKEVVLHKRTWILMNNWQSLPLQHCMEWNGVKLSLVQVSYHFSVCFSDSTILSLFCLFLLLLFPVYCSFCSYRFRPFLFLDYYFSAILVGSTGKYAVACHLKPVGIIK